MDWRDGSVIKGYRPTAKNINTAQYLIFTISLGWLLTFQRSTEVRLMAEVGPDFLFRKRK